MEGEHNSVSLMDELARYSASGAVPMHMPGHKRNLRFSGGALPLQIDITEIHGFDSLHGGEGILKGAMNFAAEVYGSRRTFFLVNGATCGLLASIRAATARGDRVLVAQNCHMSVYHALELCGLSPVFVQPPVDPDTGIAGSIIPSSVARALDAYPDIKLMVITSPTYDGVISDIGTISGLLHGRGAVLLVDEAHGAHLPFDPRGSRSAIAQGADVVVHSVHKTLPSMTQTALLHIASDRVDDDEVARQLSIFETSSPSFVLMASIDQCVRLMAARGRELMRAHLLNIGEFSNRMRALKMLKVICHGGDSENAYFYDFDESKLLISTARTTITGYRLMDELRRENNIELEMATPTSALAMTSISDGEAALGRLADALLEIDSGLASARTRPAFKPVPPLSPLMTIDSALTYSAEYVRPVNACGLMALEYVWSYPPGIPILVPGALVTPEIIEMLSSSELHSSGGRLPDMLKVAAQRPNIGNMN